MFDWWGLGVVVVGGGTELAHLPTFQFTLTWRSAGLWTNRANVMASVTQDAWDYLIKKSAYIM